MLHQGIERALTLLYDLQLTAREEKGVVLIKVDSKALGSDAISRIEAIGENPYVMNGGRDILLTDQERKMLEYINIANLEKKVVSFGDITSRFEITKPTTRSKIKRFEDLGFVYIEEKGRVKIIRITSKGRIMLSDGRN